MTNRPDRPPPRVPPRLRSVPKIRQLYWCDFPEDAQLPELWKTRPVIILSKNAVLSGAVTIITTSTEAPYHPASCFKLTTSIDERESWAICNMITSVAVSRLSQTKNAIPRLPEDEFNAMLKVVLSFLPVVPAGA